ncbi:MAG: hypothetical protein HY051_00730 [Candidatus Aenigmarchaeota archaeon]|nr:hypothetical protein [Candidatus Aenigmarchaeota archaeon]
MRTEPQILTEILKEVKDVKRRVLIMQHLSEDEVLTKDELKQLRKARADFKKGRYVTLEQLKEELGMK